MDYADHKKMLIEFTKAQEAEHDRREKIREVEHFLNDPDGQWEPGIIQKWANRPRYTIDLANPVVERIWGDIAQNDFDIRVDPAGGDSTKEIAKTYDGIIRNIETMSNASNEIYSRAGKKVVQTGFSAWLVKQRWADGDAFEQDLFLEVIHDAACRLWFDSASLKQTREDARFSFLVHQMSEEEYKTRFPDGNKSGIPLDLDFGVYYYKPELCQVVQVFYKKPVSKTLYLMSNGAVYDDTQAPILDELEKIGITVERTRKRETFKVCTRFLENNGWLDDEKETVFENWLPTVPTYANYSVVEGKPVYWGAVEKILDPCRIYNYSESRKVEEVALAPRAKLMMTPKQAAGHEAQLRRMNTSIEPVQFYNPDEQAPQPYQTGGAQINPGLSEVSQSMAQNVERVTGVFGINPQNNTGLQSGVALEQLQNAGQTGTYEYFEALRVSICHTAKILIKAIPKVYDTPRKQRVMNEDGSYEMQPINQLVIDNQTGQPVTVNDLSQGTYDVTVSIGVAFKNRQKETNRAIIEMAGIMPGIMDAGADILLNNLSSPGMDILAERIRAQMIAAGTIPFEQMTQEEQEQERRRATKPQAPDPNTLIAQAEIGRVEAETADIMSKAQEREQKMMLEMMKAQNDAVLNEIKTLADALKTLREASGADAMIIPDAMESAGNIASDLDNLTEG